jgi:hypothetical protein
MAGDSGERLPQGRLMCTLGGSLREKQKSKGRRRDKDRTVDQEQLE